MKFMKRIFIFGLVNLLVIVTISTVLSIFNVQPYLNANGLDMGSLAIFCLIWGMGGAFISLGLSRIMAKWMMGVKVIKEASTPGERWLVQTVHRLAQRAGLGTMPEVGIYESPEANAFATGPTRNRALVAVSSGLLSKMNETEVEGVLAHEVAHIANGDMVTMTLVQGVMNAFVMFIARVISFFIAQQVKEESRRMVMFVTTLVLEILLSFLAYMVVAYVSRLREFRADKGGADLAGREKMSGALRALQRIYEQPAFAQAAPESPAYDTLKISSRKRSGLMQLMSTHPPLEERLAALNNGRIN